MKKQLLLLSSGFAFFGIFSVSFVYMLKKIIKVNKKKFIKALANLLSLPLRLNNQNMINDFLNVIIKLPTIKEIIIVGKKNIFDKNKNIKNDISYLLSENIIYKNKTIGYLKIYFI
jgi:hypothetical protein